MSWAITLNGIVATSAPMRAASINHPLTDKGLEQFLADWRKAA